MPAPVLAFVLVPKLGAASLPELGAGLTLAAATAWLKGWTTSGRQEAPASSEPAGNGQTLWEKEWFGSDLVAEIDQQPSNAGNAGREMSLDATSNNLASRQQEHKELLLAEKGAPAPRQSEAPSGPATVDNATAADLGIHGEDAAAACEASRSCGVKQWIWMEEHWTNDGPRKLTPQEIQRLKEYLKKLDKDFPDFDGRRARRARARRQRTENRVIKEKKLNPQDRHQVIKAIFEDNCHRIEVERQVGVLLRNNGWYVGCLFGYGIDPSEVPPGSLE